MDKQNLAESLTAIGCPFVKVAENSNFVAAGCVACTPIIESRNEYPRRRGNIRFTRSEDGAWTWKCMCYRKQKDMCLLPRAKSIGDFLDALLWMTEEAGDAKKRAQSLDDAINRVKYKKPKNLLPCEVAESKLVDVELDR